MLAYLNKQLHYINKEKRPLIVIYGSTQERMKEISEKIENENFCIIRVDLKDDFISTLKQLKPQMVIIGGRCGPADRFLIRHTATEANRSVMLSEPGIGYLNEPDAIAVDVEYQFMLSHENQKAMNTA